MGGKARGDLVAAVAAKDVIGLSKAEARAAKEEVVLEILGDDRLSEKALSGLFMEAGGANGGPCLFPPFFFSHLRFCLRPQRASALNSSHAACPFMLYQAPRQLPATGPGRTRPSAARCATIWWQPWPMWT